MTPELPVVDLAALGFDGGAHVLVKLALADRRAGEEIGVSGTHPDLLGQIGAWCRQQGHRCRAAGADLAPIVAVVERGPAAGARWVGAERSGRSDPGDEGAVVDQPPPSWGLAARGAAIEPGGPPS